MCILHRDLGAHFVRGVTPDRYLANYMGRSGGVTGGKDGNMHFGDRELGCVGMVSMLPDMALVASGHGAGVQAARRAARRDDLLRRGLDRQRPVARGDELRRRPQAAGRLHAREQRVRLLDPERARVRGRPGRARARPTASPGVQVDGNDVEAVFEAARVAAERARAGERPDADRVPDDAHARPRRPRRHELRARRSCSRSGPSATRSTATRSGSSPSTGSPPTRSSGSAPTSRPTSTSARRRRSTRRCPTRRPPRDGVFADELDAARRRPGALVALGNAGAARVSAA